jgi:hypothetical protein
MLRIGLSLACQGLLCLSKQDLTWHFPGINETLHDTKTSSFCAEKSPLRYHSPLAPLWPITVFWNNRFAPPQSIISARTCLAARPRQQGGSPKTRPVMA